MRGGGGGGGKSGRSKDQSSSRETFSTFASNLPGKFPRNSSSSPCSCVANKGKIATLSPWCEEEVVPRETKKGTPETGG